MKKPLFRLYHHPLDPSSRRVRLALAEKSIDFESSVEKPWEPRTEYLALNPAGEVPTLEIIAGSDRLILSDAIAICEYLEETIESSDLLGEEPETRAEVRRLVHWFECKVYREVTSLLLEEKAMKRLKNAGQPDSNLIRVAYHNIRGHMEYIGWLTERRNWLAGEDISLADLAAAAQFSVIDFLGDAPWSKYAGAKEWYARIKSRPSFRPLLNDHIAGLVPPRHYIDLDF